MGSWLALAAHVVRLAFLRRGAHVAHVVHVRIFLHLWFYEKTRQHLTYGLGKVRTT